MIDAVVILLIGVLVPTLIFNLIFWDPRKRTLEKLYAPLGLLMFFLVFSVGVACWMIYILQTESEEYLKDQAFWLWSIFAFCVSLFFATVELTFRVANWNENKIMISRIFRPQLCRNWSDLKGLERAEKMQAWRLRFADGKGFGFHDYMRGTGELVAFAQEILGDGGFDEDGDGSASI